MALPMTNQSDDFTLVEAFIRAELAALEEDKLAMNKAREYFDGEQSLVYTTQLFHEVFGAAFEGFRDNWCKVIVNAVNNRTKLLGFAFDGDGIESEGGDDEASQTTTSTSTDFALANQIWNVFRLNEIPQVQKEFHEGILVEGRAFIIVWPDDELGATIDWQPGQICRVAYDPDRRTRAVYAIKHWTDETGAAYLTVYTPESVFKYQQDSPNMENSRDHSGSSALTEVPTIGSISGSWKKRQILGEAWPLDHSFGVVPVVEFNNAAYASELIDAIPQQDALNATLLDMMVAGQYQAANQRYIESSANAPEGGWKAGPGEVWHLKHALDADGKPMQSKFGEFSAGDPGTFIQPINMWLQHMANTTSTPARLFVESDRGGRGDSPSGESLLVEDKPLNDKVHDRQDRWGNRWLDVARLVATAINADTDETNPFLLGEATWQDPRHDFKLSLIQEAAAMVTMGVPLRFAVRHLSLTPEEQATLQQMIADDKAEAEAKEQEQMALQKAAASQSSSPSSGSDT